jgi:hypothetical protein
MQILGARSGQFLWFRCFCNLVCSPMEAQRNFNGTNGRRTNGVRAHAWSIMNRHSPFTKTSEEMVIAIYKQNFLGMVAGDPYATAYDWLRVAQAP